MICAVFCGFACGFGLPYGCFDVGLFGQGVLFFCFIDCEVGFCWVLWVCSVSVY